MERGMKPAYLSLGSNQGDRLHNLTLAIEGLEKFGVAALRSSVYETEPVDVMVETPAVETPAGATPLLFLNCAVVFHTPLSPLELLTESQAIERNLGRSTKGGKSPRPIDIDILLVGDFVVDSPVLTVPHPAMHRRRFVLEPLAEIAPFVFHPVLQQTVRDLLRAIPPQEQIVRRYVTQYLS